MLYTTEHLRSDLKSLGPEEFTKRIERELAVSIENVTSAPKLFGNKNSLSSLVTLIGRAHAVMKADGVAKTKLTRLRTLMNVGKQAMRVPFKSPCERIKIGSRGGVNGVVNLKTAKRGSCRKRKSSRK
jgi:hypothetical protein